MYELRDTVSKYAQVVPSDLREIRSLDRPIAEPRLLHPHAIIREEWVREGRELGLGQCRDVLKGREQARVVWLLLEENLCTREYRQRTGAEEPSGEGHRGSSQPAENT